MSHMVTSEPTTEANPLALRNEERPPGDPGGVLRKDMVSAESSIE